MSKSTEPVQIVRPAGIRASASFFPELESLRGWAILLVLLFHADGAVMGNGRIGTTVSPLLAFITTGYTGVTLFFVLSAFLLARPFLGEGGDGRRVDLENFVRRRVLRIMPLYTAAVVAAVAFSYSHAGAVVDGLRALIFLNSFTGSIGSLLPYSAVWWSLATEVQFYVALPLLGIALRTRRGRMVGIAALLVWAIAYAAVATDQILLSNTARFRLNLSILGRAPAFLFGIAASWIVLHYGERIRSAMARRTWLKNGGADLLLLANLFALSLLLQKMTYHGFIPTMIGMPAWHIAESFLWTTTVLFVVLAPLRARAAISNRVMGLLGLFSYSLYMIHEPIMFFGLGPLVGRGVPVDIDVVLRIGVFSAAFALCIALSAVTYRLIERPFLVRKEKIGR